MSKKHRLLWIPGSVALAAGLLAATLLFAFRESLFPLPPLSEIRDGAYSILQAIPAPVYFIAFVILPTTGFPMTLFYLTALPVLGSTHPAIGVVLVWLGLALNMALMRLLTHGLFQPAIEWVIRNRHLTIPKIRRENEWTIVVAMRISPLPWALQNYVLALGHARWKTYLWLSLPIQGCIGLAMMLVGESVLTGGLGYLLLAGCIFLVMTILLQNLRKRLGRVPAQPAD